MEQCDKFGSKLKHTLEPSASFDLSKIGFVHPQNGIERAQMPPFDLNGLKLGCTTIVDKNEFHSSFKLFYV